MKKTIKLGSVSVDSGQIWIGDPCYIIHPTEMPKSIGKNWEEFCEKIKDNEHAASFNHDGNFAGLGICASSGYGDGYYPVSAVIEDDRIKSLTIKFF
jgi:hypothetical protein